MLTLCKKILILNILFSFLTSWLVALPTPKEIFENLKEAWDKKTPTHLSAVVSSKLINAQLKRIPKDKITFGKKPYVQFIFKKGLGFRILIKNVDQYYEHMLSLYEEMISKSGLFVTIDKSNTYPKFIGQFKLYWLKGTSNFPNRIKIVEKDALPGDYGIFYLDDKWNILKSEYYEEKKKVGSLQIEYSDFKSYRLIKKLVLQFEDAGKKETVDFVFDSYDEKAIPTKLFQGVY